MLLQQCYTVPGDATVQEYLRRTTAVIRGACSQVCEFTDQLYLTGHNIQTHPTSHALPC